MPTTIEKKEAGYNFPLLTNDPAVSELSEKLRELNLQATAVSTRLKDKITEIRKNCPHDHTTGNWEKDPNYCVRYKYGTGEYGEKALISKTCNDCGQTIERPKGADYQICRKCWGEMEYTTTIPGQGEREKIYECKNCGSAVSHT